MPRRSRLAIAAVTVLSLSACTQGSSDEPEAQNDSVGDVKAAWREIDTTAAAPAEPRVSVGSSLAGSGGLPALVAGQVAAPDAPAAATVWPADGVGPHTGQVLEVGEGDASIGDLAAVGETTYALGGRWYEGRSEPFLQSSADRQTWSQVELPGEVNERGIVLSAIAGQPEGGVVAVGMDEDELPIAVLVETGEVVDLPAQPKGRLAGIIEAEASDRGLVVLTAVEREDGGGETQALVSVDGGATWSTSKALPGTEAVLNGMVAVKNGFVATGYSLNGGEYLPAAWFSKDGTSWKTEALPAFPGHHAGWASWVNAPSAGGGTVFAALSDEEKLFSVVLRRSPAGRWSRFGDLPSWRTPGGSPLIVADGREVVAVRSWNGLLQTGKLSAKGAWSTLGETGALPTVDGWETIAQLGEETALVGSRSEVELSSGDGWTRTTSLTPFSLADDVLESADWQPAQVAGTSGMAAVTHEEGNAFVASEQISPSDVSGVVDESDVTGWFRAAGAKKWKPARGLAGPRTEFLGEASIHDGEWVVTGVDRASFVASDHSYGALWTSRNGVSWKRAKGPFDVDRSSDSWLNGTCVLPGGDLVAVGGVEDPTKGVRPVAFRRGAGGWKRLDIQGLGAGVTGLDSCAGTDDVVLFQGTAAGRDATWSTTDGEEFTSVEIGGTEDNVGTIVSMDQGFAAPGGVYGGQQARAVVWLSADGVEWSSVDVPVSRPMAATSVLANESGLVVGLESQNGPAVAVLENVEELLQ
ncbi:hypothetical protein [Nocardioides houyundeii]|uniref:hypothetical protein n=1 Tax=Nocardioides houyundeii TaxID=2045452 RepID=UPI0013B4033E|nr:hypothetical protein [Nocardioides houyundeii]